MEISWNVPCIESLSVWGTKSTHNKNPICDAGDVAHEMALVVGGSQFFAMKKHGKKGPWLFMLNTTRVYRDFNKL